LAVVILVVGFGVYYGMNNYNTQPAVEKATEVYTCSMHPEIIRDEPGNCPICGMNLKKVTEGQSVESHSIDHLYDQLISLWWGLSNYNSKGYGYQ
jgi:Cu(I)/Ag(I) efflux system membrane fusion protein